MAIQPIKTSLEFKEKMSIAASILSGLMFLTTTFGDTFGFEGIAAQIVQILSAFIALINGWFGGVTIQKIIQERKDNGTAIIAHYTMVAVAAGENPQGLGLYEMVNGNYVATTDTKPVKGKTYYRREEQ